MIPIIFVVSNANQASMFAKLAQHLPHAQFITLDQAKAERAQQTLLSHGIPLHNVHLLEVKARSKPYPQRSIASKLLSIMEAKNLFQAWLSTHGSIPSYVVFGNDLGWLERCLIQTAKKAKHLTCLIQDGIIGELSQPTAREYLQIGLARLLFHLGILSSGSRGYGRGNCDTICVFGEYTKRLLIADQVVPHTIHITGQIGLNTSLPNQTDIEAMRNQLGLQSTTPYLVFVSQAFSEYGIYSKKRYLSFVENLAYITSKLKVHLVIKLHPQEPSDKFNHLASDCVHPVSFVDLKALLCGAQSTIVMNSTVGLQSLILGTPLIIIRPKGIDRYIPYGPSGAAIEIDYCSVENLKTGLARALEHQKTPLYHHTVTKFIEDQIASGDALTKILDILTRPQIQSEATHI